MKMLELVRLSSDVMAVISSEYGWSVLRFLETTLKSSCGWLYAQESPHALLQQDRLIVGWVGQSFVFVFGMFSCSWVMGEARGVGGLTSSSVPGSVAGCRISVLGGGSWCCTKCHNVD